MKALLINPAIYDFAAYDLWMKPLGFLSAARLLLQNGWKVDYFDFLDRHYPGMTTRSNQFGCGKFLQEEVTKPVCYQGIPRRYRRFGLPAEVFRLFLKGLARPDLILITSGMTYWYPGVKEAIAICREHLPGVPVILGGIYASLCPEHGRALGADFVFIGKDLIKISSLISSIAGKRLQAFPREQLEPAWELYGRLSYLCVRTSNGCPFRCSYCASSFLDPELYQREPQLVAREISFWTERFQVTDVAFYDDALLLNFERHLKKILQLIPDWQRRQLRFHAPNGLNIRLLNREVAFALKEAGFRTIRLSLESEQPGRVASSHKVSFADFERAMMWLREAGFTREEIGVYIMVGWPGQLPSQVARTIHLLKEYPCRIKLAEYSPVPSTATFQLCQKLHPGFSLQEPLLHNNSIFPAWHFPGKWDIIQELKELVNSPAP